MNPTTADPELHASRPSLVRDVLVILLTLAIIAGVGLAVWWPWRSFYHPDASPIDRYQPSFDGWASLTVKQDASGQISLWQSANLKHLRNAEGYATELSKATRTSIEKLYTKGDNTPVGDFVALTRGATFVQERVTELDAAGVVTQTMNLRLRNAEGEYIVSLNAQALDGEVPLTPPGLFVPADLRPGKTWTSAGQIGGQAQYTVTGTIAQADPYGGELGKSNDCVQAKIRFQIAVGGQVTSDRHWADRYCAGLGQVEEVETDAAGTPSTFWRVVAVNAPGATPVADKLPAPAKSAEAASTSASMSSGTDGWEITRIGRVAQGVNVGATIAPTYLPTDPPALLVATYEGDLTALDALSTGGDVLWRFNPTGTVFGQPAFDAARERVYFGASDKHLYALDSRGLFLWSFATGDNVATRPLVAGDLVIFGGEDRNAYAVEAQTGKLRWQQGLGSPVVASPALAKVTIDGAPRDVAIFGSDDGAVFGLDAKTGEQLWQYDAGGAVEAAIVVDGDQALVASAGGTVTQLNAATGEEAWAADLTSTHTLRDAPAVTADRVYVVDRLGYLTALARSDGRRIWQSLEDDYFGAPIPAGDEVLVATDAGIVRVGADGARRGAWAIATASDAADTSPRLDFGPAAGGGALWTIDGQSVVRRIGAPLPGPRPLPLAWNTPVNTPPFVLDLVRATPVRQGDSLLALDEGGRLYRVEPKSGTAVLQATTENQAAFIEPLIAGDLLVVATNKGLTASRLSDGGTAWHLDGAATFEPPVLAGDAVVWMSIGQQGGVRLAAVEAKTGAIRWERTFAEQKFAGGVVAAGNTVYAASPPAAFDVRTGKTLWEVPDITDGLGAPALSADGKTVYIGRITMIGGEALALDAVTGKVRWQQPLPGPLNLVERPWVAGAVLVIPTLNGSLVGLDAADGSLRWMAKLPATRFGAVTVDKGLIYTGLIDGQMLILSAESGQIVARRGEREGGLETYSRAERPVLVGNQVIMSFGSTLKSYAVPGGLQ